MFANENFIYSSKIKKKKSFVGIHAFIDFRLFQKISRIQIHREKKCGMNTTFVRHFVVIFTEVTILLVLDNKMLYGF